MIKDTGSKFEDYSIHPKLDRFYYTGVMNQLKVMPWGD